MKKNILHKKKSKRSNIKRIIILQILILFIIANVKINLQANDYQGETNIDETPYERIDGTQDWYVSEIADPNNPDDNGGATGTKVTVIVGEDETGTSKTYTEGDGVDGTVYKGYDWSSCTGNNAPPSDNFNTDSDQMKSLVDNIGLDDDTLARIENGETVTVISEPTIRVKNAVTGEQEMIPVTDLLELCEKAAAEGVANGEGIRYTEDYAKSILAKIKEEQPELYEQLLANKDGQGQVIHQEQLYPTQTPTPTPVGEGTPTPTPAGEGTPTPTPAGEGTPTPTPSPSTSPSPTPEPTPEPDPSVPHVSIIEGDAPKGSDPTASGRIYNDEFGVPTNPIPVKEELSVKACTNLLGDVENLGLYTVKYEPFAYTYTLNWQQYGEYTYYYYECTTDEDGNETCELKSEKRTGVIDTGTYSEKITLSGTATFIKIRDNTDWFTADDVTITSVPLPSHTFDIGANLNFTNYIFPGADVDRVSCSGTEKIVTHTFYKDEDETVSQSEIEGAWATETSGANVFHFWTHPTTDWLKANGSSIKNNGAIVGSQKCFTPAVKTIPSNIPNRSLDSGYPSSGIHKLTSKRLGGTKTAYSFTVNPVRIHTPIYNELIITSPSVNQRENLNGVTEGYKLVTLGDEFTVTVNISGPYEYYYFPDKTTKILSLDTSKYVKDVIIECGVCGKTYHSKTHTCPYYNTLLKNDNTEYQIKTTVIAVNNGTSGTDVANKNEPDDIYILEQYGGVHLVGKMYDLQVRTTDDPGWKLRKAQDLASLPIGEKGDNVVTSYQYGIKLGYRAYFDLKTLGTATEDLYLTPKIYYVDKSGTKHDVDLYYKTSLAEYKKLDTNDIKINMIMNSTNGDVNNDDFAKERASMLTINPNINYNQNLLIGGLKGINLTAQNSVATKYNGVYIWNPTVEQSRRWYGEIYIPASTVVAEKGATINEISRGNKVYKDGYLVIMFENMVTRFDDGSTYLQYSMGRDTNGNVFSPNSSGNLVSPSIMYNEKTDDGKQALKNKITLPNGAIFTDYKETEAPLIIYDVSLRANDDYEQSGTH